MELFNIIFSKNNLLLSRKICQHKQNMHYLSVSMLILNPCGKVGPYKIWSFSHGAYVLVGNEKKKMYKVIFTKRTEKKKKRST